ncbi:MAG: hypothetical protein EAX95_16610, partial [Candidatus Thorarchaeota archaeon]|nr:hypothetical protein [Candidatus Thorarchaeota archaeon]
FQMTSILVFWGAYSFQPQGIAGFFSLIGGIFGFVFAQGIIASNWLIPQKLRNIGFIFFMGIVCILLETHVLFTLQLFVGLKMPLPVWLSVSSLAMLLLSLVADRSRFRKTTIVNPVKNRSLFIIFLCAVVLRMLFFMVGQGTMATDAALYADYARSIVEGAFQSSVLNDSAVFHLATGVDYLAHQAYTYASALAWMLFPVGVSGPNILLVLIGSFALYPVYSLANRFYDKSVALLLTFILSTMPIFVFHSAVGYGPEILSLFLAVCALSILTGEEENRNGTLLVVGVTIGLIDVIWFTNFYVICLVIAILSLSGLIRLSNSRWIIPLLLAIIAGGRLFYMNMVLFCSSWLLVFIILAWVWIQRDRKHAVGLAFVFVGILAVITWWRLPTQLSVVAEGGGTAPTELLFSLLSFIELETAANFFVYIFVHVTPVVLVLAFYAAIRPGRNPYSPIFLLGGVLLSIGTLRVLSTVEFSLGLRYMFSDSRFFLFIVLLFVLAAGGGINCLLRDSNLQLFHFSPSHIKGVEIKTLTVFLIIFASFGPSYFLTPSGLTLVHIEDRYGWKGLETGLGSIGSQDSVFLVERAREFSWFTNRKSAVLGFPERGLTHTAALYHILQEAEKNGASYLVIDSYTTTSWNTVQFLQYANIGIGKAVLANISALQSIGSANSTGMMSGLILIMETEPNSYDRTARVYEFADVEFIKMESLSIISPGWEASNSAIISNLSGSAEVQIALNSNFTVVSRCTNLNLGTQEGFMLLHIENVTASVDTIEILNQEGQIVSLGERIRPCIFYVPIGEEQISDIRIQISGIAGSIVLVHSISVWRAV